MIQESIAIGELSKGVTAGMIARRDKGGDPELLTNWRPNFFWI